jgi:hypothetical protein
VRAAAGRGLPALPFPPPSLTHYKRFFHSLDKHSADFGAFLKKADLESSREEKQHKLLSFCSLYCTPSKSLIVAKILPRMARMTRISFEQKRTKETKEEFFFVAFVCFCANSVRRAARIGNSESVKSVKSVVKSSRK